MNSIKTELEKEAEKYSECHQDVSGNIGKYLVKDVFIDGAKSDAARDYWFKIYKDQL